MCQGSSAQRVKLMMLLPLARGNKVLQRLLCAGSGINVGALIFERESVTLGLNPATGLPRLVNKKKKREMNQALIPSPVYTCHI